MRYPILRSQIIWYSVKGKKLGIPVARKKNERLSITVKAGKTKLGMSEKGEIYDNLIEGKNIFLQAFCSNISTGMYNVHQHHVKSRS